MGRPGSTYIEGNGRVARSRAHRRTRVPVRCADRRTQRRAWLRRASRAHARRRRCALDDRPSRRSCAARRSTCSTRTAATTASSRAWPARLAGTPLIVRTRHLALPISSLATYNVDTASRDRGQPLRAAVPDFGGCRGGTRADHLRRHPDARADRSIDLARRTRPRSRCADRLHGRDHARQEGPRRPDRGRRAAASRRGRTCTS